MIGARHLDLVGQQEKSTLAFVELVPSWAEVPEVLPWAGVLIDCQFSQNIYDRYRETHAEEVPAFPLKEVVVVVPS